MCVRCVGCAGPACLFRGFELCEEDLTSAEVRIYRAYLRNNKALCDQCYEAFKRDEGDPDPCDATIFCKAKLM